MPSNDEVVLGIPSIQCPSCRFSLDLSGKPIEKFTKEGRIVKVRVITMPVQVMEVEG